MPIQTGVKYSERLLLVGAGCTGAMLFKNIKFSDVLGKLQSLVKDAAQTPGSLDILAVTFVALGYGFMWWKVVEAEKFLSDMHYNLRQLDNSVSRLELALSSMKKSKMPEASKELEGREQTKR